MKEQLYAINKEGTNMNELTEQELLTLIRLVKNLISVDNTWENRDLLAKLQREYNDRYQ